MLKKISFIILIMFSVSACKTTKVTNTSENMGLSSKKIIKNHYTNTFNKKTINAKLKIKYKGKSSLPSVTGSLRLKKDETIWISLTKLGFPVGKVLITPNRVSFYEKINRTYFEGDFSLLSDFLGTELNFQKVQDLLLGQSLLDLKKESFDVSVFEKNYMLKPKVGNPLFDILFLINPINFKMNSQQLNQKDENNTLVINYANYETIENEFFPREIHITASDTKNVSTIDVDYKSVEFNKSVSFPFEIPKNYEKIELK
ncbi:DUF4292 domain-containing protein [Aureibaculum sp. 2210JD6-5]|uniref:DUF4292 domain-containing protein n=1 Tax=Aureibaculum sp. 2210JD6-5 TaxID=3103957 RepID=UPI002AAC791F|nr:DUF4292 domain-containing protein [Aureibaculum sp. 2210JD6-5]MDY7394606.1 DUF4292 domain-containing protein [Aureibaculum sp. 2210JD6-5]